MTFLFVGLCYPPTEKLRFQNDGILLEIIRKMLVFGNDQYENFQLLKCHKRTNMLPGKRCRHSIFYLWIKMLLTYFMASLT